MKAIVTNIFFYVFLASSFAQDSNIPMRIHQITVEDGLSQGTVYSILKDSRHFLWFSSYEGLNRYDGNEIKVYRFNPSDSTSLQGSSTIGITEDKNGDIWVGTEKCLNHYRRQTDNFEPVFAEDENGNIKESINLPFAVDDENIWYINSVEGILKYNFIAKQKQVITSRFKYKRSTYVNNSTIKTKDGRIWFRLERGIIVFDPDKPEDINWYFSEHKKNKLGDPSLIICAFEDSDGLLWLGSREQIILFNPQLETYQSIPISGELGRTVTDIKEDKNGNIIIGTEGKGLLIYDKKTKQLQKLESFYHFPNDQKVYSAATTYVDKEGIIWSNADPKGINIITPNFKFFKKYGPDFFANSKLKSTMIRCFAELPNGKIWIGTFEDGIYLFNPKTNQIERQINSTLEFDQNHAGCLMLDQNQGLWIGTYNGLFFLENENGPIKKIKNIANVEKFESSNLYWHIVEAKDGTIIFSTDAGIYYLENKGGEVQMLDTLQNIVSGYMHLGTDNHLFIPEYFNGFYVLQYEDWFHNKTITKKEIKRFLPEINVKCFYPQPGKNIMWISTNNGLLKIHHQNDWSAIDSMRHYTQVDGLPSNYIYGILEDEENNLWMSTNRGISKFNPSSEIFQNYSTPVGIQGFEFNSNSFLKTSKNEFYFGGTQGFNRFIPNTITQNPNPPLSIELVDLQINGKTTTAFGNIGEQTSITLNPNQNTFTFKYVAIDYLSEGENRYQVYLEGMDEGWQNVGNKNSVRYTKVPSGNYSFHIKAANSDGVWGEEIKTISIKILAPWYRSWWAYLLYVSSLGILVYSVYNFRRRRKELRVQLVKEQEEADRLKDMDNFKNTFFTNITHEFRTPLTVIQGMSAEIKGNKKAKQLIQHNSYQLLELINQLLDLSKIESGNLPMNWEQRDIINYLNYITESLHSFAYSKKISLAFHSELEKLQMDFDAEKLQTILINLISNAIKFTPEYGKIILLGNKKIIGEQLFFILKISDSGKGIPSSTLPYIFDRYFQVEHSNIDGSKGTGIGLALVKELTEMHDATIEVKSVEQKGTTFTLKFPITQNAILKDEVIPSLIQSPFINSTVDSLLEKNQVSGTKNDLEKLLIIEDNYDVIQYLTTILNNKYEISIAKNGRVGIEKALLEIPDIIVSDVMMPEKDGFEVCATLKQDERTSHIPIILLTAKATTKDKIEGLQFGADAYLMKPFDKEELLVRLEKLIELRKKLQTRFSHFSSKEKDSFLSIEDKFLQKLNIIIDDNLKEENFTVPFLCKKIGMSNSQLYRKLKAVSGFSIANYIRYRRLLQAHQLIKSSNQPIKDIAFKCGFSNLSWFSQSFKEAFGYPPNELRK